MSREDEAIPRTPRARAFTGDHEELDSEGFAVGFDVDIDKATVERSIGRYCNTVCLFLRW